MSALFDSTWDATSFFQNLTDKNKLARDNNFVFCRVSGLQGFEEALGHMMSSQAFVCVSDISDGFTDLNNTPRTRRVKTVFFAMRHAVNDMTARADCMGILHELFRQFMSVLLPERTRLLQQFIILDPRISFKEIDAYFFSGCACAFFQVAVEVHTDLRYDSTLWTSDVLGNPL